MGPKPSTFDAKYLEKHCAREHFRVDDSDGINQKHQCLSPLRIYSVKKQISCISNSKLVQEQIIVFKRLFV